jgi:hypothetical protein
MKTTDKNSRYLKMSFTLFIFWMLLITALFLKTVTAQVVIEKHPVKRSTQYDPNFPAKGRFNTGLLTTYTGIVPPPAVVADVTYGLSNKLSVGILGGTTGAITLAGLKLNASLIEKNNFRIIYRMMIIYYPERNGKFLFDKKDKHIMPWMLSMGVLDAEWKSETGIRWSLGMGLLETHCIEGMKKYFGGISDEEKESPFEIFHTFQGSVSIPVSKKLTLRPEVIAVMKGKDLVKRGEFKVFPINPFVKLIYTF